MTLPGLKDELGATLRRLPGKLFAVLDGAHFDDLPGRLRAVGLTYDPLYMDEIDAPQLNTGPHLVSCPTAYATEQVRDVAAGAPTVVWWAWPDRKGNTHTEIYHHLRRLNLMDVPHGVENSGGAPRYGQIHSPGTSEPVLFRHADPDVVANILPVLAPIQRARFFGGALALVAEPPSQDGVMLVPNAQSSAPVPFGRLRLSAEQYSELTQSYGAALRRRAVIEFGPLVEARDRSSRDARITDAIDRAESYGCSTKEQVWDFIRMDLRHGARFELQPRCKGVLTQLMDRYMSSEERMFRVEQELQFLERHGEL
jgi:hypothetical protein